jgi:hypothetical protein
MWEGGLYGLWMAFRRIMMSIVDNSMYGSAIMACVLVNVIILASDGLVDKKTTALFNKFNYAFTLIFTIDMGLKLVAMGILGYVRDKMNIFDAVINALSLLELALSSGGSAISAFRSIRIFRAFRILRATRMLRTLKMMQIIIKVVTQ